MYRHILDRISRVIIKKLKIFKNFQKYRKIFWKNFQFFWSKKKKKKGKKSRGVKINHRQNMVCHTPFNTEFNSVIGSNELISQISAVYEIVKNLTIGFRDRGSLFDSKIVIYRKSLLVKFPPWDVYDTKIQGRKNRMEELELMIQMVLLLRI